jgi:hypothetical protein
MGTKRGIRRPAVKELVLANGCAMNLQYERIDVHGTFKKGGKTQGQTLSDYDTCCDSRDECAHVERSGNKSNGCSASCPACSPTYYPSCQAQFIKGSIDQVARFFGFSFESSYEYQEQLAPKFALGLYLLVSFVRLYHGQGGARIKYLHVVESEPFLFLI